MYHNRARGFSLIELVIAVAIVGILAAIAYPAYTSQLQKNRRAECEGALVQLASVMERDFSRNNNQYRNILGLAAPPFPNTCPIDGSSTPTYNINITAVTASTYTLTATPVGAQINDVCGNLTLTNLLQKGQAAGMTIDQCWR